MVSKGKQRTMAAGAFKQGCLAILDEVEAESLEIVITKRGRPVAKVVPLASPRERELSILADLRGRARMLVSEDDFLSPSMNDAGWMAAENDA